MTEPYEIVRLSTEDFDDRVGGLAELLVDAVRGGASLGFVEPFDVAAAAAWWLTRRSAIAAGGLLVWAATTGSRRVDGTVSLVLEEKPNGRHRAAVWTRPLRRAGRRAAGRPNGG